MNNGPNASEVPSASTAHAPPPLDTQPMAVAIFRDTANDVSSLHAMKRANPIDNIDSMDMDTMHSNNSARHEHYHDNQQHDSQHCHCHLAMDNDDDVMVWNQAHQRVISPFPDVTYPEEITQVDSWNDNNAEHWDFSQFFPAASGQVMEWDDFSLSSATTGENLLEADDFTNPESFWEAPDHLGRSASPAQVTVTTQSLTIVPPSPTSTTQVPEGHALVHPSPSKPSTYGTETC